MSKRIDKFVLWTVIAALSFTFFSYTWKNTGLALALTAALIALLYLAARQFSHRYLARGRVKKESLKQAQKRVSNWIYASPEQVLAEAEQAILGSYGIYDAPDALHRIVYEGKRIQFALLLKHPDGLRADATEITALWKIHQDADAVIVINTGKYDEKALSLSQALSAPKMTALDAHQLTNFVSQTFIKTQSTPKTVKAKSSKRPIPAIRKTRQIPAFLRMTNKKSAPRNALYGVLLMALYFVVGIETYLIAALFLIALAAVGWRKPGIPNKLI